MNILFTLGLSTVSILLVSVLSGCDDAGQAANSLHQVVDMRGVSATPVSDNDTAATGEVKVLSWDNLLPEDFHPEKLLEDPGLQNLSDDDPRAQELMKKLQAMWKEAPVVNALNGQSVKLPGFVVPLEGDGRVVNEFLLVPYYGACIHVPPPPANQIVYVRAQGRNVQVRRLFDTVWVTGVMKVEHASSELGEAGYTLDALEVEPYEMEQ
ncbi:MAG: DUF3299 domain-containing protein [Gammaproteobacteria bacterium]|nr:DUF3299 domain-containing protein [Gammaproteobacteria bacterium]